MMKCCEDDDADQMRSENISGVAVKTVFSRTDRYTQNGEEQKELKAGTKGVDVKVG